LLSDQTDRSTELVSTPGIAHNPQPVPPTFHP